MKKQGSASNPPGGTKQPSASIPQQTEEPVRIEVEREFQQFLRVAKQQQQIDEDLASLKEKSIRGDQGAIKILYYLAAHSTETLNEVAAKQVETVRPLSRELAFWPMLTGPYEATKAAEQKFLKHIQLGDSPASISAKKLFKRFSVPREVAVSLISWVDAFRRMERTRKKLADLDAAVTTLKADPSTELISGNLLRACASLPEFSAQTLENWYPVCKQFLTELCGGHPEQVKELRSVGSHRAKHTVSKCGKTGGKSQESNIRDGIFKQIKRAMKSIARDA